MTRIAVFFAVLMGICYLSLSAQPAVLLDDPFTSGTFTTDHVRAEVDGPGEVGGVFGNEDGVTPQ